MNDYTILALGIIILTGFILFFISLIQNDITSFIKKILETIFFAAFTGMFVGQIIKKAT